MKWVMTHMQGVACIYLGFRYNMISFLRFAMLSLTLHYLGNLFGSVSLSFAQCSSTVAVRYVIRTAHISRCFWPAWGRSDPMGFVRVATRETMERPACCSMCSLLQFLQIKNMTAKAVGCGLGFDICQTWVSEDSGSSPRGFRV